MTDYCMDEEEMSMETKQQIKRLKECDRLTEDFLESCNDGFLVTKRELRKMERNLIARIRVLANHAIKHGDVGGRAW